MFPSILSNQNKFETFREISFTPDLNAGKKKRLVHYQQIPERSSSLNVEPFLRNRLIAHSAEKKLDQPKREQKTASLASRPRKISLSQSATLPPIHLTRREITPKTAPASSLMLEPCSQRGKFIAKPNTPKESPIPKLILPPENVDSFSLFGGATPPKFKPFKISEFITRHSPENISTASNTPILQLPF